MTDPVRCRHRSVRGTSACTRPAGTEANAAVRPGTGTEAHAGASAPAGGDGVPRPDPPSSATGDRPRPCAAMEDRGHRRRPRPRRGHGRADGVAGGEPAAHRPRRHHPGPFRPGDGRSARPARLAGPAARPLRVQRIGRRRRRDGRGPPPRGSRSVSTPTPGGPDGSPSPSTPPAPGWCGTRTCPGPGGP